MLGSGVQKNVAAESAGGATDPTMYWLGIDVGTGGTRALLVDQALIVKAGIVHARTVQAGYRTLDFTEAVSGLADGDHVVLSDQDKLHPGEPVRQRIEDVSQASKP